MREQMQKPAREEPQARGEEMQAAPAEMPLIVSARTGLAGKDEAMVRRVPVDYLGKSMEDVLNYITTHEVTAEESGLAESIKRELRAREKVVIVNGKKAELKDKAGRYAAVKEHKLPTGVKQYQELEIEVSSVQQGGLYKLVI